MNTLLKAAVAGVFCTAAVWGARAETLRVGKGPNAASFTWLMPGEKELQEDYVDQYNFEEKAPLLTDYAPKEGLQAVLEDSLQRMGVRLYHRVGFPGPYDTPAIYRVRAGFGVALSSWDGALLLDGDKLTAPYRKALEQAKEDVALVLRLRDLIAKARAEREDLIYFDEGRRAGRWLAGHNMQYVDPDLLRLEIGAWIRRMEAIYGIAHGPDPKPAEAIAWVPDARYAPFPDDVKLLNTGVRIPCEGVPLDTASNVFFSCSWRGFSVTVRNPKGKCALGLWVTGPKGGEHLRYDCSLNLDPPPSHPVPELPPCAPFPERGLFNWAEPRFHSIAPSAWEVQQHATYGRSYPNIGLSQSVNRPKKGTTGSTNVVFSASWDRFWGWWPASVAGRSDRWRVTVTSGGAKLADARLCWPKGTVPMAEKFAKSCGGNVEKAYEDAKNSLYNKYAYSGGDYLYSFPTNVVSGRTFNLGDMGSDGLFWCAYAAPIADRRATPERRYTLGWDVTDARLEFLRTCYSGGKFKDPPKPKPKKEIEMLSAPNMDVETDDLQLDDPE